MSQQLVRLVQNTTGPNLLLTLFDKATGTPIDLTAATLSMAWRAVSTTVLLPTTGMTLTASAPLLGQVTLAWGSVALFQPVGTYEGQITIVQGGVTSKVYDPLRVYLEAAF